jgi:MoxR-like ATPase
MSDAAALVTRLEAELDRAVVGLTPLRRLLTVALIGRGHVLIEGPPGLGKTLVARTFAHCLGGTFQRIQGTADLMPSDVTGQNVFDQGQATFSFRPGPLFASVVLADELNRASPKTQSALLEAMAERHVTVDRVRHALPDDFLVIATQNPFEFEGTYPLPESQLDRFMLSVSVDYPDEVTERGVLERYGARLDEGAADSSTIAPIPSELISGARAEAAAVHVAPALSDYVLSLVRATRVHPAVSLGVSTRGALALLHAARIAAVTGGSDYVTPDDVKEMAPAVLSHRLGLKPEATLDGATNGAVIGEVVSQTPVPR